MQSGFLLLIFISELRKIFEFIDARLKLGNVGLISN